MPILRKITVLILILSITSLNLPTWSFAQPGKKQTKDRITKNQPNMLTTPEVDIPLEKSEKKISKWVWIGIGALAIGGIAAAASGGGDDDGGSTPVTPAGNTGEITVKW